MQELPMRVPCVEVIPRECPRGLTVANCVYCKYFVDYIAESGEISCLVPSKVLCSGKIDESADYD